MVLVYLGILSLIVVPIINHDHAVYVVKTQLMQYLKTTPESPAAAAAAVPLISGTPISLSINRLSINLPIMPGFYRPASQTWTLNSEDVFTDNNINPNPIISTDQKQVTFLYGHDIPGILIKTSQLVYGDLMTINTNNGYRFSYYYADSAIVPPTDSAILSQANIGNPVELMTCTGLWYQFRHVMYFHLISVTNISTNQILASGANV